MHKTLWGSQYQGAWRLWLEAWGLLLGAWGLQLEALFAWCLKLAACGLALSTNREVFSLCRPDTSTLKLFAVPFLVLAIRYILNWWIPTGPAISAFIVLLRSWTSWSRCYHRWSIGPGSRGHRIHHRSRKSYYKISRRQWQKWFNPRFPSWHPMLNSRR